MALADDRSGMEIEVIASGKGSVTIKSDGEYTKVELMWLARGAERLTEKLVKLNGTPKKMFGFSDVEEEDE